MEKKGREKKGKYQNAIPQIKERKGKNRKPCKHREKKLGQRIYSLIN